MNLSSLQLGLAFRLLMKTLPILLIRLGATLAFWVVALIYLAIVIGVGIMIGKAVAVLGWIVIIVALASVIPLYNLAYRYVFYMIKAAHIAVMAEMLTNENLQLPAGRGQLDWGKQRVTERFGQVNGMFVVDELVQGVVGAFTRTVYSIASWLPGDTLRTLVSILNRVIRNATSYIDEAVLARSFWEEDENIWENARDGVVLYAMSWKPILTAAVALMILSFIPAIVAFVIFALPVGLIVSLISETLAGYTLIFLLMLAWLVKVAVGDAFAVAAIIATYRRETVGKVPDAGMAAHLDSISDKFSDLKNRAQAAMTPAQPNTAGFAVTGDAS